MGFKYTVRSGAVRDDAGQGMHIGWTDAYVYAADLYCEDCGSEIQEGKEDTGDSNDYPQGPYPDGGGESDGPQHCGSGAGCVNAMEFAGTKVGVWLGNPLTQDGVEALKEMLSNPRPNAYQLALHEFWSRVYSDYLEGWELPGMNEARRSAPMTHEGGGLHPAPYSKKNLQTDDFMTLQPNKGGWIVDYRGEFMGSVKKLKDGWKIDAIHGGGPMTGRHYDACKRATELLDAYFASGGVARERIGLREHHEMVDDPFYVIQGIYKNGYISDNFGGYDDEETALAEAAKFARSPFFEGDYVRIITRDGDLVWDSRGGERTSHGTWALPEGMDEARATGGQRWKSSPGSNIQAPLSWWGDYVISHRPNDYTVSYRPEGHHVHVGSFTTLALAKTAAHEHAKLSPEARLAFKPTPWLNTQDNLDQFRRDLAAQPGLNEARSPVVRDYEGMTFEQWLAAARSHHDAHVRDDSVARMAYARGIDPHQFVEMYGGFALEEGGGGLLAVRLDDPRFPGNGGVVVAHVKSAAEFEKLIARRDGARDPNMRLWRGDAPVGTRVGIGPEPRRGGALEETSGNVQAGGVNFHVNFQRGERLRIRIKGQEGQPLEAFWYTVDNTMSLNEVALQFAQTNQPGVFIEIVNGKLKWAYRVERHAGQPAVARVRGTYTREGRQ
jgi:hypothetical protein